MFFSLNLFDLLIALNKELLPLLTVKLEEVGIEISRICGKSFISPGPRILIIDISVEPFLGVVAVHFELFRQGCLSSGLNLLDLVTIECRIIQNLPFLDLALVHLELFFL